jgi:hypothetical protein
MPLSLLWLDVYFNHVNAITFNQSLTKFYFFIFSYDSGWLFAIYHEIFKKKDETFPKAKCSLEKAFPFPKCPTI